MAFDGTTKAAMFGTLRAACGASGHYAKLGTTGATAILAIRKASTRKDSVTGAGLDSQTAGRLVVKTADFSMPDNRKIYWSTDSGVTYTAARIQSVETMADSFTAIEFDSLHKGTE